MENSWIDTTSTEKSDCMQFEKYLEYIISMCLRSRFETRPDWKKEPSFQGPMKMFSVVHYIPNFIGVLVYYFIEL